MSGDYTVLLPGRAFFATALVTAVGTDAAFCNVQSWTDETHVRVRCYTAAGVPKNSTFTLANFWCGQFA